MALELSGFSHGCQSQKSAFPARFVAFFRHFWQNDRLCTATCSERNCEQAIWSH